MFIKPQRLKRGDTVATISPSWGGAGEPALQWRYKQGIQRLEDVFGLNVIAMPNSLKGADYLYHHPEARADDLMEAFKDSSIKAIIANIGGEDSIRLLPYIDMVTIRENPKIVMGYSDVTVLQFMCMKAGLTSFYGPAILTDFAENVEMDSYTIDFIERTLFSTEPVGNIQPAKHWTSEFIDWVEGNHHIRRNMRQHTGYEVLQGKGIVQGPLIGGCMEVLETLKGTELWPSKEMWRDCILFFETSEEKPPPRSIRYWLRNYAAQGILDQVNGIIFGKPQDEEHYEAYKVEIITVMKEYELQHIPIMYNANFGHTEPKCILPYGVQAEINCEQQTFSIIENGVQ
ncbi:MAG TPA: S66 peptidase family protein [Sporosarcina sp.]|nr:S66 peptidase family protein [Sporosarcina sp.]